MTNERRLGRGLEALLGRPMDAAQDWETAGNPDGQAAADAVPRISVYEIDSNPFQPRREFDEAEIDGLADSIRDHGLIQPILLRRFGDRYQLIAGERRLRAVIKAGWPDIPAQIRECDDQQLAELAIVENLQRKDLNALEKAASFQQYLEMYHCTQEELAGRLKIDRSTVANLIRLLELPHEVQDALRRGGITAGHARALLPLGDDREQVAFSQRIEKEGLSVRVTETLVQETIRRTDGDGLAVVGKDGNTSAPARTRSENLKSLEQEFRLALGTKVEVKEGTKGRGKIVIHFGSHEEFERLRGSLQPGGSGQFHQQAG